VVHRNAPLTGTGRLRLAARLGPARVGFRLGLAPPAVHAVLARYGCPRLADLDRATGTPVRRYERERPGELVHGDVRKLGNIPDGGGWRTTGRAQGKHAWYAAAGITIERVLSGNGACYRSRDWAITCADPGAKMPRTQAALCPGHPG
jgi:hypothetical protein